MNRRKFLNKTAKYTVATAVPFILPSGRLFAATGNAKVKHVVFCLFAGAIRTWESIDKKDGNLMRNTLHGNETISNDIAEGIQIMPKLMDQPLQQFGTLFKKFRYENNVTLHYNAHAAAVTGKYYNAIELMKPIKHPSIFEYFRKHSPFGDLGLNTWWVSDQGGPFPYLQYSKHPLYGYEYAANMIQPTSLFKFPFADPLSSSDEDKVKTLSNLIKSRQQTKDTVSTPRLNKEEDRERLRQFILKTHNKNFSSKLQLWDDLDAKLINDDMITMFTACNILNEFKPNLLVLNMQDSDIAHSNFTDYCNNLHRADYALAKMWKTIQDDPDLKDNTVLIAVPECGRNVTHNSLIDAYGRFAVDHTGDELSKQMFCLIAGPPDIVQQNKVVNDVYGTSIDIVPTIAHLFGFHQMIPSDLLDGKILHEAFV